MDLSLNVVFDARSMPHHEGNDTAAAYAFLPRFPPCRQTALPGTRQSLNTMQAFAENRQRQNPQHTFPNIVMLHSNGNYQSSNERVAVKIQEVLSGPET